MLENLTYHARVERVDRLQALEEVLGFTKVVLEVVKEEERALYQLTSSGIIIVRNLYKGCVVTAFMATIDQCYALYRNAGKKQMSPKMEKRVKKNAERHKELFLIKS